MQWRSWLALVCALSGVVGCPQKDEGIVPTQTPSRDVVRVTEASGTVEVEGAGGTWRPLAAGAEVSIDSVLRTGTSGQAVLSLGDDATVRIAARTTLSIAELEKTVSRITLSDGRITAVVGSDATMSIESGGVTAAAGAGEVSALADGQGRLAVVARTARVRLTAAGKSVDVAPGEQAVASAETGPSPPGKIPASLFLKLGAPKSAVQREKTATVTGETVPGALVSVNGVRVGVSTSGTFKAPIPLNEGVNEIKVTVIDASGRESRGTLAPITVDSRVGETKGGVTWE